MDLLTRSLDELHIMLADKKISSTELTELYLQRVQRVDGKVQAFLQINDEKALAKAKEIDMKIASGAEIGILEGIPMALKDNMCTEGIKTTCGSKILEGFVPPYSAEVAVRLDKAGAVLIGKLNMDEFAMGSSNENSGFYPAKNPWNLERVPGGSSGGSAASIAALEVPYALGSDTGGSIRQPASFCGVVGLKPTYGAVSRYGLVAFASSLDQIGPLTRTVKDNAHVLNVIAGHDAKDSTSVPYTKPDYTSFMKNSVQGLKIGVPKEFFAQGLNSKVEKVIKKAIETYEEMGAEIVECSLPHMEYAMPVYYIIATAEASSNLARYDGVRYGFRAEAEDMIEMYKKTRARGFGDEVKRRIMLGTYALSSGYYDAYYLKAQKVRTLIRQDFANIFEQVDVIMSPAAPTVAYKLGEKSDPLAMYLGDVYTIPVNLAGLPSISIPAGFASGMPVGLQIIGKHFDEGKLYQAAYAFEQNTDFHNAVPALSEEVL